MKFIFGIIGGYIGALIDSLSGFCFGVAIGFLFGYVIELKKMLQILEEKISRIQLNLSDKSDIVDKSISNGYGVDNLKQVKTSADEQNPDSEAITQINTVETASAIHQRSSSTSSPGIQVDNSNTTSISNLISLVKSFFTTGNVVVKAGVIILFFGVAFLLKYAMQRNAFPIELRLLTVSAGAIGMLIFGWRIRLEKLRYALVLQGGAVGILYLTVFSAAKLYSVLPFVLTLLVMIALVVFACLLAILQNSRSLACFATIGGFLAPVLISSGSGSHIALFSYYALLNAGIFGIAWFKAWRILNWLGFVFTFVIASLWGHDSYRPEYFNTTEPFLILFFFYYVVISVLYAYKQPPQLKGLVDGSLVFGVPLVGFALQSLLVAEYEYGQALSACMMGAVYLLLASWLWGKSAQGMRLLAESFLALGIIFGSLAIPFTLDGNWTAAAWALEGAGISWIGIRQQRLLSRIFGVLLQLAGGLIFFVSSLPMTDSLPILNSAYIGLLLLSIGGLFSAFVFYKHKFQLMRGEQSLHWILLAWALIWWFCSGLIEIDRHVLPQYQVNMALFFIAISMLLISLMARLLSWKAAEFPPVFLLPGMYLITLVQLFDAPAGNLLSNFGYISWIIAFTLQLLILYRCKRIWSKPLLYLWHSLTLYLFIFLSSWIVADIVNDFFPEVRVWADISWGAIPALIIFLMMYFRERLAWPLMSYPQSYLGKGLLPVVTYLGIWVVFASYLKGDPHPLPYVTIINPLELSQLFCICLMFNWALVIQKGKIDDIVYSNISVALNSIGVITFIWLTSVVAHSVHFYAGIRFTESAMMASNIFQTSLSIVWTLMAVIEMWLGTRKEYRKLWFAGAGLLTIVVIKLFLIDLADSGGITRIVSFMTVGILILVIGYFSPIPPKKVTTE